MPLVPWLPRRLRARLDELTATGAARGNAGTGWISGAAWAVRGAAGVTEPRGNGQVADGQPDGAQGGGGRRRAGSPRDGQLGGGGLPSFVVCGDDPLAHRLVEELTTRYGAEVTVILPDRGRNHGPQLARLPRVRIVEAERLDVPSFQEAGIGSADALALVQQDDVGNIHAALTAQELNPGLRLVVRMFNMRLGNGIRRLFADCAVISDAEMAAPAFVAAALGEVAPTYVQLSGRLLYVARRTDVPPENVICGLADTRGDGDPVLLPRAQQDADLILAVADGGALATRSAAGDPSARGRSATRTATRAGGAGEPEGFAASVAGGAIAQPGADQAAGVFADQAAGAAADQAMGTTGAVAASAVPAPQPWRPWRRRRLPGGMRHLRRQQLMDALHIMIGRRLWLAFAALVAVLIIGTVTRAVLKGQTPWEAAYVTLLTAVGGASPDDQLGAFDQVFQIVITLAGIAIIPVVTAAVVEAVVNSRLALALGRLRAPVAGHVVVAGLGNVGTRVIRQLHDLGVPVVAIDKTSTARGVQIARDLGIPLIIGDASREETLAAASIRTASALVALSTNDVINLEAALYGRAVQSNLRVILRLFDGDFASRVEKAFGITTSHSVSYLAAPAFAAAMHERAVIGTIPVERRVLLLAEAPVGAGSALAGGMVGAADRLDEVRVVAVLADQGRSTVWSPRPDLPLHPGDVLVVVASRAGFGRILARSQPVRV